MPTPTRSWAGAAFSSLRPPFAADLRALAAWRGALGLLLVLGTLHGLSDLARFVGDAGLLPRSALTASHEADFRPSLHLALGSVLWAALLALTQLASGVALLFGWKARGAALLGFLLAVSWANRNPLVVSQGDAWLIVMLAWAALMPISARWSIDAATRVGEPSPDVQARSWATSFLRLSVLLLVAGLVLRPWSTLPIGAVGAWLSIAAIIAGLLPWWWAALSCVGLIWGVAIVCAAPLAGPWMALVLIAASTALIPGIAFEQIAAWFERRRPRGRLRIFFDRDCGFCERSCRILRELLIAGDCDVLPAQSNARADALRIANASWVVIGRDDKAYLKWLAFRHLLSESPIWRWLNLFLALVPQAAGDALYDHVARQRAVYGRWLVFTQAQDELRMPGRLAGIAAVLLGVVVLLWQLGDLHLVPGGRWLSSAPARLLRVDAPSLRNDEDHTRLVPRMRLLRGGDLIDPRAPDAPAEALQTPGAIHDDAAMERYARRLLDPARSDLLPAYGDWWCRRWNAGRDADDPARATELRLVAQVPDSTGTATLEQRVLSTRRCSSP